MMSSLISHLDSYIYDLSTIENDNLRAVAEDMQANGYYSFCSDVPDYGAIYLEDGSHYDGFSASYMDDHSCVLSYVFQMDDALYNRLSELYIESESAVEDDGTVITYTNSFEGGYWQFSYNRDTGVGIESSYLFF